MERLKGYYRVKYKGVWTIAEYKPSVNSRLGHWLWVDGVMLCEEFDEITGQRISMPDDPQEIQVVAVTPVTAPEQTFDVAPPPMEGEFIPRQYQFTDSQMLDFIERHQTLHKQVEFTYVVDGYHAEVTWDLTPISETFKGDTLRGALDALMQGGDVMTASGR
ncbi:hypothetical protein [Pseudomonas serbica]|uniref:hypothetical protein n=1 Tax=Pseudomonas serbica TaxID=2965074 RepID=UPI00237A49DD|nr:hypothetical protein [Pseudomonas serbica]